ncbi:hypothetical protein CNR22_01355 [Sphingobacteriaceae bacterium]|nr:hypothetical protein CNR22_01355 [Sphingobacteriaceae bacterium]
MKKIISITLLVFFYSQLFSQDSLRTKKILIVATNITTFGVSGNGSLSWEIGFPFQIFIDSGYQVDIVTPKGGKVALYDLIVPPELEKILKSELFVSKTKNSLRPAEVKDSTYIAVFYPGGYGQFVDVVDNTLIAVLTAKIFENGGLIGTTGNGTASLVNIKLSNTKYFVDGKKMTCFPLSMEKKMNVSNFGMALPFDMEAALVKRGANLIFCPKENKPKKECLVVVDEQNRLVTGMGAFEAQGVAEEMIKLLLKH